MKGELNRLARALLALIVLPLCAMSATAQAQEEGAMGAADTAAAVDVIVNIDKDSRVITLKNEAGDQWTFTAGPEVRNFDQLKRGDLVLTEYYSAFAVALGPEGSGIKGRISDVSVDRAKLGEKPGVEITGTTSILAAVTAVDTQHRMVTVQGVQGSLTLKVSDDVDLSQIEVGQKVEARYVQSYAISVVPAPKVSGTVTMKTTSVALGVGAEWGKGTLTMYDGTSHDFSVKGLSVLDVGISSVEATGEVYRLVEAKDLEGTFLSGEAGGALIGGGSAATMENRNGVVMKLKSTQQGLKLTFAAEGLKIKLK